MTPPSEMPSDEATAGRGSPRSVDEGRAFRAALTGLGVTLAGFARLTGMSRATVYGWGIERRTPNGRSLQIVPVWAWLLIEAWRASPRTLVRQIERMDG